LFLKIKSLNIIRRKMKYGAGDQLVGRIIEIKKEEVMSQVELKIIREPMMCSVMTKESLKD
jgi:molybdopterin-binding protein